MEDSSGRIAVLRCTGPEAVVSVHSLSTLFPRGNILHVKYFYLGKNLEEVSGRSLNSYHLSSSQAEVRFYLSALSIWFVASAILPQILWSNELSVGFCLLFMK